MPSSGATKPEGATSFDGEEPTEVIALPRAPQKTIEMRVAPALKDEEGPDRTYFAPRAIPTQAVPDQGPEDNKIVINVKTPAPSEALDAKADDQPRIDAERARRRAPTVRIERGTLKAQGLLPGGTAAVAAADDGIDVSFDGDEVEPPPELLPRKEARQAERGGDWVGRDAATRVVTPAEKRSPLKLILLGVVLIVALGGGTVFALGYFGVVVIPGVPRRDAADPPRAPAPPPTTAAPPTSMVMEPARSAQPAQTQTAEPVVSSTNSAFVPQPPVTATVPPRPFVKPRWVPPPATTKTNPTSI